MKDIKRVKIKRLKKTTQIPEASNITLLNFSKMFIGLTYEILNSLFIITLLL